MTAGKLHWNQTFATSKEISKFKFHFTAGQLECHDANGIRH
jgi:hypothetical protein